MGSGRAALLPAWLPPARARLGIAHRPDLAEAAPRVGSSNATGAWGRAFESGRARRIGRGDNWHGHGAGPDYGRRNLASQRALLQPPERHSGPPGSSRRSRPAAEHADAAGGGVGAFRGTDGRTRPDAREGACGQAHAVHSSSGSSCFSDDCVGHRTGCPHLCIEISKTAVAHTPSLQAADRSPYGALPRGACGEDVSQGTVRWSMGAVKRSAHSPSYIVDHGRTWSVSTPDRFRARAARRRSLRTARRRLQRIGLTETTRPFGGAMLWAEEVLARLRRHSRVVGTATHRQQRPQRPRSTYGCRDWGALPSRRPLAGPMPVSRS